MANWGNAMIQKRAEEGNAVEPARRLEDAGLHLAAMRSLLESATPADTSTKKEEEKLSLFWRVFGGTIISITALVAVTLYNNMAATVTDLRSELIRSNEARMLAVSELRADLSRVNEGKSELVRKDEFNSRITKNWDGIQAVQSANTAQNASITSLKTEHEALKERLVKLLTDLETLRKDEATTTDVLKKELITATEAIKKDIAAVELLRERTSTLTIDLKGTREELIKIRQDVDRNQTQDLERRDRRDSQYKAIDEHLKELTKGFQECREKLARLEAITSPPQPAPAGPAPKKATVSRSATVTVPKLEVAPEPRPIKRD
jgi:DNA repair exonuclease SbcCD ATPase subunit